MTQYNNEYFENLFHKYSEQFGNSWGMNWRAYMKLKNEKTLSELKKIFQEYPTGTYLETGCASGDFTERIIKDITAKGKYVGTDISDAAIAICKKRFQNNANADFAVMALPDLPKEYKYDCIICMDVFEYFDDAIRKECLKRAYQSLKQNGRLVLQVPLPTVDEVELMRLVRAEFGSNAIETVSYAYGSGAQLFEYKLVYVANMLYRDRKMGWFGIPFGWLAYRICANEKLIRFFFSLNERFAPETRSHVTIVAQKR